MSDSVKRLRACFLLLAALGIAGTAVELAMERHWRSTVQVIPWIALGVAAVAVGLLAIRPNTNAVRIARVLAAAVSATAVLGLVEHVRANFKAGPLDFRYTDRWATMTATSRWWAALTKSVGPAPPIAPAVLIQVGLCLWFATLTGRPADLPAPRVPAGA